MATQGRPDPGGRVLLVRADADPAIGTGHVMRCLALSQAWLDRGGEARFACASCPSGLRERLAGEGIPVEDVAGAVGSEEDRAATDRIARGLGASWIVVDGYGFGSTYVDELKAAGHRILQMDDCAHLDRYGADLVLNQNIYARDAMYEGKVASSRLMLGSEYALLRREFWRWRGVRRTVRGQRSRVLVTLGGSDSANTTARVLEALRGLCAEGLEVAVVAGSASPHLGHLRHLVEDLGPRVRLEAGVRDMTGLMEWADIAVTAGGSTCWEAAFMGLPCLVFVVEDNQRMNAEALDSEGVATNLGSPRDFAWASFAERVSRFLRSGAHLREVSRKGQLLVDAFGAERVAKELSMV